MRERQIFKEATVGLKHEKFPELDKFESVVNSFFWMIFSVQETITSDLLFTGAKKEILDFD